MLLNDLFRGSSNYNKYIYILLLYIYNYIYIYQTEIVEATPQYEQLTNKLALNNE